ncbi:MAG: DUF3857 domain-containing protein [Duncaniella sp.]|nr:DUF3857 domain-containing protein [Duncaniella sp.]
MKRTILSAIILLMAMVIPPKGMAKYDEKFFKKAAEKVWAMDLPQFDPSADLSDSIFRGASTVCIARYSLLTAMYESDTNIGKYLSTGRATTHVTIGTRVYRVMVKLNDSKAVEDYTTFDIDVKNSKSVEHYTYATTNTAFGARIYKPDGKVTDVDVREAFTVTEGKNDKEAMRKLAIPGLAPGDVLEYFYYEEMYLDEVSIPAFQIYLLSSMPTKNFTFECELSPLLTLEYASYNGAPLLGLIGEYNKDLTHVGFSVNNLAAIDTKMPYFYERRQLPYLNVTIQNNTSNMLYHPKSARVGGVNLPTMAQIMTDAGHSILDTSLPEVPLNKALKLARQWRKAHPEASQREYIDAAWLSLLYVLSTESRSFSDRAASVYFVDMLSKLKIKEPAYHALATSRSQAPIQHLTSYNQVRYGTQVGDSLYMLTEGRTFLPGQIPGLYAGEEYAVFKADRNDAKFLTSPVIRRLPQSRPMVNTARYTVEASLDPDDMDVMNIGCTVVLKGASKAALGSLIFPEAYYGAIERYLGITDGKGYKSKADPEKMAEVKSKLAEAIAEAYLDTKLRKSGNLEITSIGCTPDSPNTEFGFTAEAENLVSQAGNNLLVNLGKLAGNQLTLTESQRTREIEAILPYPTNERIQIIFTVPEGYTVNPESLEALNMQINNNAGSFATRASVKADNKSVIELTVMSSLRHPVYSAEQWPEVVTLLDAFSKFNGASLLLTPVK